MIGRLSCLAGLRGRPRFKAVPHHHTPLSHQVHSPPSGCFLPAWGAHDKLNGTPRRAESLGGGYCGMRLKFTEMSRNSPFWRENNPRTLGFVRKISRRVGEGSRDHGHGAGSWGVLSRIRAERIQSTPARSDISERPSGGRGEAI